MAPNIYLEIKNLKSKKILRYGPVKSMGKNAKNINCAVLLGDLDIKLKNFDTLSPKTKLFHFYDARMCGSLFGGEFIFCQPKLAMFTKQNLDSAKELVLPNIRAVYITTFCDFLFYFEDTRNTWFSASLSVCNEKKVVHRKSFQKYYVRRIPKQSKAYRDIELQHGQRELAQSIEKKKPATEIIFRVYAGKDFKHKLRPTGLSQRIGKFSLFFLLNSFLYLFI